MRLNWFSNIGIVASLILCGCSSITEMDNSENDSKEKGGFVKFSIGGNAVLSSNSRSKSLIDAESAVHSLYAVVFRSAEDKTNFTTSSACVNSEEPDDLFLKCIDIIDDANTNEDFSFDLPAGYYNICFVANADKDREDNLESKLKNFVGNVSDFKSMTADTPLTTENGLLMVSDFYGIKVNYGVGSDLGTIFLKRAMARIDIENKAKDLKIISATLNNQNTRTYLFSNNNELSSNYAKSTVYSKLEDAPQPSAIDVAEVAEAAFYTYENLNSTQTISLTLDYEVYSKRYRHIVEFKNADDTNIILNRNTIYTITLDTNLDIQVSLSTFDWDEGVVIETVNKINLVEYIQNNDIPVNYDNIEVGDFMLDDGSVIKRDDAISYPNKDRIIGMVALLYEDCPDLWRANNSHGGFNHGLVLSCRDLTKEYYGEPLYWGTRKDNVEGLEEIKLDESNLYENILDGYRDWLVMEEHIKIHENGHTAWNAVKKFRESSISLNARTTNWYMPAHAEMIEIVRELTTNPDAINRGSYKGDDPVRLQKKKTDFTEVKFGDFYNGIYKTWYQDYSGVAHNIIDSWFGEILPSEYYDEMWFVYWMSTEWDEDFCSYAAFEDKYLCFDYYFKNASNGLEPDENFRVRCVLAF